MVRGTDGSGPAPGNDTLLLQRGRWTDLGITSVLSRYCSSLLRTLAVLQRQYGVGNWLFLNSNYQKLSSFMKLSRLIELFSYYCKGSPNHQLSCIPLLSVSVEGRGQQAPEQGALSQRCMRCDRWVRVPRLRPKAKAVAPVDFFCLSPVLRLVEFFFIPPAALSELPAVEIFFFFFSSPLHSSSSHFSSSLLSSSSFLF